MPHNCDSERETPPSSLDNANLPKISPGADLFWQCHRCWGRLMPRTYRSLYLTEESIPVPIDMIRELLLCASALLLLAYVADSLFSFRDDPREPPRVRSKIPLIGHVIGLMRHGPTYYKQMRFDDSFRKL